MDAAVRQFHCSSSHHAWITRLVFVGVCGVSCNEVSYMTVRLYTGGGGGGSGHAGYVAWGPVGPA